MTVRYPLSSHRIAIVAALNRGISYSAIARAYGVRPQAVQQYCVKHNLGRSAARTNGRKCRYIDFTCSLCGKDARRPRRAKDNYVLCSDCVGGHNVDHRLDRVVEAISMRLSGMSWKAVGQTYFFPQQTVQRAIYQFLHANDLATNDAFSAIWYLSEGSYSKTPFRLNWLNNKRDKLINDLAVRRYANADDRKFVESLILNWHGKPFPATPRKERTHGTEDGR